MTAPTVVDVSLVSHGHGALALGAMNALALSLPPSSSMRLWLTLNLPEPELEESVQSKVWPFELHTIHNLAPLGFGANHNQAFGHARSAGAGQWFAVMNPDIFWPPDAQAFWADLADKAWPSEVGLVCPKQIDAQGQLQDFARQLMTPWSLAWRVLRRLLGLKPAGVAASVESADWVNGACMVWRTEAFAQIGGFDERYFMYCEDTDICLRLQLAGWCMASAGMAVVHDARRNTGRSLRHLRWHVRSMLRLWCSSAFWRFLLRNKMN